VRIIIISTLTLVTVGLALLLVLANTVLQYFGLNVIMPDLYKILTELSLVQGIFLFYGVLFISAMFVFGTIKYSEKSSA